MQKHSVDNNEINEQITFHDSQRQRNAQAARAIAAINEKRYMKTKSPLNNNNKKEMCHTSEATDNAKAQNII